MADRTTPATKKIPRILLFALPVLVVVGAVAAIVPMVLDDEEDAPVFTSTSRTLTYEIIGVGRSEQIIYTTGVNNEEKTVLNVKLPWKKTIEVPVGVQGGTANLTVRNPETGEKLTCRISMGGKIVNEVVSEDGYVDPSCSVPLAAERAK